jgi:protein TonB
LPVEQAVPEVAEQAVSETVPEILVADRAQPADDDNVVQKPAEKQDAESVETAEAATQETAQVAETMKAEMPEISTTDSLQTSQVQATEITKAEPTEIRPLKPIEDVKPETASKKPVEKTEPVKPAKRAEKKPAPEKPKQVAKAKKATPRTSGKRGENQVSSRRGQADGQLNGDNSQASRGGSKNGEVGNAAVSNYPGKVMAKLRRAMRSVSKSARAKARNDAQVAFTVSAGGGVSGIRIARSSGSAEFDQVALALVRRAAPFPPIPAGAGRSSWQFAVPLGVGR